MNDKLSGATDMIVLCSALGPHEGHGPVRVGPEDSQKDYQRAATPLLQRKAEGVWMFNLEKRRLLGNLFSTFQ